MYNVVEFEDNALGIVRENWLTPRKKECFWPPHKIASKFNKCLVSEEIPDEVWPVFVVKRILYETDDIQIAREKCKKAESESDLVSDTSENSKKIRKRKPITYSDTEDEDENYMHFKFPNPPKQELPCKLPRRERNKTLTEVNVEIHKEADTQWNITSPATNEQLFEPELRSPSIVGPDSRKIRSPSIVGTPHNNAHTPLSKARLLLQNFNVDTPLSSRSPCVTPTEARPSVLDQINDSLESIATYIAGIQSDIKEIKATQNDILLRVASSSSTALTRIALPDEIALPLKSIEDLNNIEAWLENEDNKANLVNNLSFIGGNNVATTTRRILQRVFASELALKCNWTGKNNKTSLKNLQLIQVVINAVRKNKLAESATDADITFFLTSWFRFARDRDGGRDNRRARRSQ